MDETLEIKDFAEFVRARPDTHVGAIHKQAGLRPLVGWKDDVVRAMQYATESPFSALSAAEAHRLLAEQQVIEKPTKTTAVAAAEPAAAASKKPKDVACGAHVLIEVSPALEKIIDEVLQNALDRQHKDPLLSRIDVDVDASTGTISVKNDGHGMPVTKPARTSPDIPDAYWPTIVCTKDMAGGNFTKSAKGHYAGGRNGIGMKVSNILSSMFRFEVLDLTNQLHFVQTWTDGMRVASPAEVKPKKTQRGYVRVTFQPDLAYFKERVGSFGPHVLLLIQSRAFEIAAQSRVPVYLNGVRVPVSSTAQLASLFTPLGTRCAQSHVVSDSGRLLLDVSVLPASDAGVRPGVLAFVNGIRCCRGTHVEACLRTLGAALLTAVRTKSKRLDLKSVTATQVRESAWIVLAVNLDEPAFTAQAKTELQTPESAWGFSWMPDDAFQTRVCTLLADAIAASLMVKDTRKALAAANSASTGLSRRVVNLPKYEPAGTAGKPGTAATLLLTEGDSAMTLAMAGRAVVGSELWGVYCLKGKPLNPRDKSLASFVGNEVLCNVAKILGLEYGRVYESDDDTRRLNYRFLEVFADQDHDGGHIVGLIVNWVQYCWPSLLALRPDFIRRFASPVLIGRPKRGPVVKFLSIQTFKQWAAANPVAAAACTFQYFKGLGSHNESMGQEYFSNHSQYSVSLFYTAASDAKTLDQYFGPSKVCTGVRKELIASPASEDAVDYSQATVPLSTFLQLEVLPYFREDVLRSLPWSDGLKRTQRKLLWAVRTFMQPGKVSKFTELAMEAGKRAAYHHGEVSLYGTLVAMAQSHAGSNNVNLFMSASIMGSRLNERDHYTAPRYMTTGLSPIVPFLLRKEDDPVLTYRVEDGDKRVEPVVFWPVIPLDVLNGCVGIGTGWNTCVMPYHISDIVSACMGAAVDAPGWMDAADAATPWFDHLTGAVLSSDKTWVSTGLYTVTRPSADVVIVQILDLPFGVWAHKHDKEKLAPYMVRPDNAAGFIKRKDSDTTNARICYTLTCDAVAMAAALGADWCEAEGELVLNARATAHWNSADASILAQAQRAFEHGALPRFPKLEAALGLVSTFQKSWMYRLDAGGGVQHFSSLSVIIRDYAVGRLKVYAARKAYGLREYARQRTELDNKVRFIEALNARDMDPRAYDNTRAWWSDLFKRGFVPDADIRPETPAVLVEDGMACLVRNESASEHDDDDDEGEDMSSSAVMTFRYLTSLRATQWTRAGLATLQTALDQVKTRIAELETQTPQDMWLRELRELLDAHAGFFADRAQKNKVIMPGAAAAKAAPKQSRKRKAV